MITAIVKLRAKAGRGAEVEADFRRYAEWVRANEPGLRLYTLSRSQTDMDSFTALEVYENQAALDLHLANFQKNISLFGDNTAGPPDMSMLDFIGGLARPL